MKLCSKIGVCVGAAGVCLAVVACSLSDLAGLPFFGDGLASDSAFKLVAQASAGTLRTEVAYEEQSDESVFEINVSGGVPGAQFDVVLNGVVIASITLDATGAAHVEYSSVVDDSGELPLPESFVAPQAGDSVSVGELQSTFEDDSPDDENDNDDDDDDEDGDDDDGDNDNDDGDDDGDDADDNGNDDDDDDAEENGNDNDDDSEDDDDADDNLNDNASGGGNDNSASNANDNAQENDNESDDDADNVNDNDDNDNSENDNAVGNDNG